MKPQKLFTAILAFGMVSSSMLSADVNRDNDVNQSDWNMLFAFFEGNRPHF